MPPASDGSTSRGNRSSSSGKCPVMNVPGLAAGRSIAQHRCEQERSVLASNLRSGTAPGQPSANCRSVTERERVQMTVLVGAGFAAFVGGHVSPRTPRVSHGRRRWRAPHPQGQPQLVSIHRCRLRKVRAANCKDLVVFTDRAEVETSGGLQQWGSEWSSFFRRRPANRSDPVAGPAWPASPPRAAVGQPRARQGRTSRLRR